MHEIDVFIDLLGGPSSTPQHKLADGSLARFNSAFIQEGNLNT